MPAAPSTDASRPQPPDKQERPNTVKTVAEIRIQNITAANMSFGST
jgi:hypothetical protein